MATKKMKDGRWYSSFYYTDWTGERKRKKKEGFKTKREAEEWEDNFLNSIKNSSDISFSNLLKIYLEDAKQRLKYTTYNSKEYLVKANIEPYFAKFNICDITTNHIRNWQSEMINKGFSQTYLKNMHNQLNAIFNFARKFYSLKDNPASACGTMGKTKPKEMQFWTLEEFKQFIEVVDQETYRVIFTLLYFTGIRLGEMLALTPRDIKDNVIIVNKTYTRLGNDDYITTTKTTKGDRKVPTPSFLHEILKEYITKLYKIENNERIFFNSKSAIGRALVRYAQIAGVKEIRTHDLRHSHASLLIELGYSPLLIAERLGHEDIQTTLRTYSHLYPNKQSNLVTQLDLIVRNGYEIEKIKG